MAQFLLSCESTVDVPFAYMHSRGIPVIFYSYIIDEQPYPDDMGRDPEALPRFYAFLDAGKLPSTSQINQFAYYDYFKELLEQGGDVLHIAFGSGMTQSVNQAYEAAEQLRAEFPGRLPVQFLRLWPAGRRRGRSARRGQVHGRNDRLGDGLAQARAPSVLLD